MTSTLFEEIGINKLQTKYFDDKLIGNQIIKFTFFLNQIIFVYYLLIFFRTVNKLMMMFLYVVLVIIS